MTSRKESQSALARKSWRTPGEVAFDRCFLPVAAVFVLNITTPFNAWGGFALGLILAVLWVRALVSLIKAWSDPSSRVLRFSALVLLFPFGGLFCGLLLTLLR